MDLLDNPARDALSNAAKRDGERPVVVSALTGEGTGVLLERVEDIVAAGRLTLDIDVPSSDGAGLAWLHETCDVLSRVPDEEGHVHVRVRVSPEREEQVRRRFGI